MIYLQFEAALKPYTDHTTWCSIIPSFRHGGWLHSPQGVLLPTHNKYSSSRYRIVYAHPRCSAHTEPWLFELLIYSCNIPIAISYWNGRWQMDPSLFLHWWIHLFFLHRCAHLSWMGSSLFLHWFAHLYFFIDGFIFFSSSMDSSFFLHSCDHLSWMVTSLFLHGFVHLYFFIDGVIFFLHSGHLYFFMDLFIFISSSMDSSLFLHRGAHLLLMGSSLFFRGFVHLYFFIDLFIFIS